MAEVQEQFKQATQQPQPQPEEVNWWKWIALITIGGVVLTVGGFSLLIGAVAMSDTGNTQSNPSKQGPAEEVANSDESALEGPNPPATVRATKEVKVVATTLNGPADYSIYDHRFKVNEAFQIEEGTHTFTYELPERDGLMADVYSDNWHSYVAVEVYEDGKLVAQDEDKNGMASVSY